MMKNKFYGFLLAVAVASNGQTAFGAREVIIPTAIAAVISMINLYPVFNIKSSTGQAIDAINASTPTTAEGLDAKEVRLGLLEASASGQGGSAGLVLTELLVNVLGVVGIAKCKKIEGTHCYVAYSLPILAAGLHLINFPLGGLTLAEADLWRNSAVPSLDSLALSTGEQGAIVSYFDTIHKNSIAAAVLYAIGTIPLGIATGVSLYRMIDG